MEYFDVLNKDGTKTGKCKERNSVHRDGDYHGSIHVWIIQDGEVLVQKRARNKDSFPGYYDVASSGHLDANESYEEAAIRECYEEIGIVLHSGEFQYLFEQFLEVKSENPHFISREINKVYLVTKKINPEEVIPDLSEVEYVKWITLSNFDTLINRRDSKFCISPEEWIKVKQVIR